MKRFLSVILLLFTVLVACFAQSSDKHSHLGVRSTLDICTLVPHTDNSKYGPGFSIGGFYNIPLVPKFYIEPGVSLFYDNMAEKSNDNKNFGLRIPLTLGYHFGLAEGFEMSVFYGAQFNYGFSWRCSSDGSSYSLYGLYDDVDGFGGLKRTDWQCIFGTRLCYNRYFVEVGGALGFSNLWSEYIGKQRTQRRNTATIGIGYMF